MVEGWCAQRHGRRGCGGGRGNLSDPGRARRRRRVAAIHRARPLHRRHRPRHHPPLHLHHQQRRRRQGHQVRPRHRRQTRRSLHHGALRRLHGRLAGPLDSERSDLRIPEPRGKQLHRHPRPREAEEDSHQALRGLRRRHLPAPRLPRHRRLAAHARRDPRLPRQHRSEKARPENRRTSGTPGVHENLGDEMGRAAPNPHGQQHVPIQVRPPILQLARGQIRAERPHQSARAGAAHGHRRHLRQSRRELLQGRDRHAENDRERRAGFHGHAHPVRPVPQPSLRPLDHERLLQLRRLLRPDRSQDRRGPARNRRVQSRQRRREPSRRQPRHDPEISRRRQTVPGSRSRPPREPRQVAGLARESLLRPQPREHRLGAFLRHGHRERSR